uniref:Uncharacterized protein n=1 Tax=Noctiluca scintillans TaxID=2966 RepID=A0A7S1ABJ1_NOCSC
MAQARLAQSFRIRCHSCNMFQTVLSFAKAAVEDRLTDDSIILIELADMVHLLFLCHAELAQIWSSDRVHQRKLLCLHACQRYAEEPSERNHAEVVDSWDNLGVRDKQGLRKMVRSRGAGLRKDFLLEVTGSKLPSEETSPAAREDSVQGSDITHTRSSSRRAKQGKGISL